MLVDVMSVIPNPDFTLTLEYVNGERRVFDAKPLLSIKPWTGLRAWALFQKARVEYGTVVWPGEIDIAPETLYDRSIPLSDGSVSDTRVSEVESIVQ